MLGCFPFFCIIAVISSKDKTLVRVITVTSKKEVHSMFEWDGRNTAVKVQHCREYGKYLVSNCKKGAAYQFLT